jgi:CTP:molybdopterin cytidylyltransferase MocA
VSVVGALLAAGAGTRFEGPTHKLLAPLRGRRVVDWAHEHAVASGLELLVVTGAVADLGLPNQRHNERWAEGMATSMQVAVAWADELGADAVVIGLGDQPLVEPEAWRLVAATSAPIAVATYGGERGNPVRLDREVWPLLPTTGDVGARKLARQREDLVVEVACPGNPADVDRLEDLDQWS